MFKVNELSRVEMDRLYPTKFHPDSNYTQILINTDTHLLDNLLK